jgi:hypothetical protein
MTEKGYTLAITPDLIDVVVKEGYHPQFGARPMRRAVQDVVEEAIATPHHCWHYPPRRHYHPYQSRLRVTLVSTSSLWHYCQSNQSVRRLGMAVRKRYSSKCLSCGARVPPGHKCTGVAEKKPIPATVLQITAVAGTGNQRTRRKRRCRNEGTS